jgi:hypothetical protein
MQDSLQLVFTLSVMAGMTIGALHFVGRMRQREGRATGRSSQAAIEWPGAYSDAFQRCLDILRALDADLMAADPNRGVLVARTGLNPFVLGKTIRCTLITTEGVTRILVEAAPSALPFDLGQSRAFVTRFLEVWNRLPEPRQAA